MNLLFVCTKNQWRSPTAERIYATYPKVNTRSAGIVKSARRIINVADIHWADMVFVMENKHKRYIDEQFRKQIGTKKVIVLDIPDHYHYMDEELIVWLTEAIDTHLSLQG